MQESINSNSSDNNFPHAEALGEDSNLPSQQQAEPEVRVNFEEPAEPVAMCSANTCAAGHSWPPVLALTKCPGCQMPMLVVKMQQCPICNEPATVFRMRTDHLPQGGAVTPMCKGSATLGDVGIIEIPRVHAKQEQENHKEREMISKV